MISEGHRNRSCWVPCCFSEVLLYGSGLESQSAASAITEHSTTGLVRLDLYDGQWGCLLAGEECCLLFVPPGIVRVAQEVDRRGQDLLCWSLLRQLTQVGSVVTVYLFVSLGFIVGAAVGKVNRTPTPPGVQSWR